MPAAAPSARSRPLFVVEPGALWLARPPLVVDCSLVVAALFEEAEAEIATRRMAGCSLHAPQLLPFEFANVARSKSRAGAPAAKVAMAISGFADVRIDLHPVPPAAMHQLALKHELSAYDAAYLWLAAQMKASLGTFDRRLSEAAQKDLGTLE